METKQEEEENEISTEDNGSEAMPIMANASTSVSSFKESTGNLSNKAKRVLQRLKKEKEVLTNKSILGKLEKFLGGNKRNAHQENTVVEEQLRQPLQPHTNQSTCDRTDPRMQPSPNTSTCISTAPQSASDDMEMEQPAEAMIQVEPTNMGVGVARVTTPIPNRRPTAPVNPYEINNDSGVLHPRAQQYTKLN
jgi:hypothetical protein